MVDLRSLPSVDALVADLIASDHAASLPRAVVVEVARQAVDEARTALLDGQEADPRAGAGATLIGLSRLRHQNVLNATGVLLHTNLGRAPLHESAARQAADAAAGYGNIEFDLARGERGSRGAYLTRLLAELTGAEAAMVVNNNAAALFLVLHTLAAGRPVPVSRGELIEIGGSYRLPDLMAASGATLIEVGTTNRTRTSDYRSAVADDTALLLKVHPSNYRVTGFAEEATVDELAVLAREHDLPFVFDVGSGLLDADVSWVEGPPPSWVAGEPAVRDVLDAGVDLVTFSGDKLFGGPQAGILVGSRELVARLKASPVARALRVDGATIAALTATAELYLDGRGAEIPFWRMVSAHQDGLRDRLEAIANRAGLEPDIRGSEAMAGAGSVPGMTVPSPVLVVAGGGEVAWRRLLDSDPIVVARRDAGDLLVDVRAVPADDDGALADALGAACRS